jgi:hypothetical protein
MFQPGYFESGEFSDGAVLVLFLVNSGLEIIFNRLFEAQISRRKRAQSRILPGKNARAVSVYRAPINQGAAS